jgi:hypothetical protein
MMAFWGRKAPFLDSLLPLKYRRSQDYWTKLGVAPIPKDAMKRRTECTEWRKDPSAFGNRLNGALCGQKSKTPHLMRINY